MLILTLNSLDAFLCLFGHFFRCFFDAFLEAFLETFYGLGNFIDFSKLFEHSDL